MCKIMVDMLIELLKQHCMQWCSHLELDKLVKVATIINNSKGSQSASTYTLIPQFLANIDHRVPTLVNSKNFIRLQPRIDLFDRIQELHLELIRYFG